ncbi:MULTISPECIES: MurR/RpiR family transcriptional regulator [Geomicrobium]|uniref:DNA-binding MurR/RpiR family transcriptional regulator n=1 Tax=Geomicrobium sediminis TaxID=1347788 RepID=A0ABS2PH19_9BACL|nr:MULTISPECIES: MurR/RpiR family transcriptional regulator [Geomicrobium]MBM7634733.1 DNA-binding MurR/RpiR family transcriptional regulator [Geomicrobium sediminis]
MIQSKLHQLYPSLSKSKQKAAHYMIEHPEQVALYPAQKIGRLANTSETTIIRLCQDLGYNGYKPLQEALQAQMITDESESSNDLLGRFEMKTNTLKHEQDLIEYEKYNALFDLKETFETVSQQTLHRFVSAITSAEEIVVIGLRTSFSAAHWLTYSLNALKGNATLYRSGIDENIHLLNRTSEKTVLIAFSFSRYTKETLTFTRAAKSRGATVLAIIDEHRAPIHEIADCSMIAGKQDSIVPSKRMISLFAIIHLLLSALSVNDYESVAKHLNDYEKANLSVSPFI